MLIDRIIEVQIALRTRAIQQLSFSDFLLVSKLPGMAVRNAAITSADDLLDDEATFGTVSPTSSVYLAAQKAFGQIPTLSRIYVGRRDGSEEPAVTMQAVNAHNSTFYGFSDVDHSGGADAVKFAAWANANTKFFTTTTSEADSLTTASTGTIALLSAGNFDRAAAWYSADAQQFVDVALMCKQFTNLPGADSYANQTLSGIASSKLTESQFENLVAKNGNSYEPARNLDLTQNGRCASGEWIDIIRGRDWLVEEMRTNVLNKFVDKKIPFTDDGIMLVEQGMRETLDLAVRRGFLAPEELSSDGKYMVPSYTISVPRSSQISKSDKAARILRDMKFIARVAGAIHNVKIAGELTYDELANAELVRV
jgi:hypothetical protein